MITDEDRYLFDLNGYIVLKGVLTEAQVAECNRIIDEIEDAKRSTKGEEHTKYVEHVLMWGQPFRDLIDHPGVLPYLQEWLDPAVRLDHVYPIFSFAGTPSNQLHGSGAHFNAVAF